MIDITDLLARGDQVEAGDTVVIVEAMKMESEFKAKMSGKVAQIKAEPGESVESGQVLVVIE